MTATKVASTEGNAKSRRALLAGALGGLGAWAASAVGRASPVRAEGEPIVVGGEYFAASSITLISNDSTDANVFFAGSAGGGTGVIGSSGSASGVSGDSHSGIGVRGSSASGTGVYGQASSGFALRTAGRTKLSTSGVATINGGNLSQTVDPGVNVTSGSFVLLTPKANIGSRALWFTTNATANTFTIRISRVRSSATKVAWLLLG